MPLEWPVVGFFVTGAWLLDEEISLLDLGNHSDFFWGGEIHVISCQVSVWEDPRFHVKNFQEMYWTLSPGLDDWERKTCLKTPEKKISFLFPATFWVHHWLVTLASSSFLNCWLLGVIWCSQRKIREKIIGKNGIGIAKSCVENPALKLPLEHQAWNGPGRDMLEKRNMVGSFGLFQEKWCYLNASSFEGTIWTKCIKKKALRDV